MVIRVTDGFVFVVRPLSEVVQDFLGLLGLDFVFAPKRTVFRIKFGRDIDCCFGIIGANHMRSNHEGCEREEGEAVHVDVDNV